MNALLIVYLGIGMAMYCFCNACILANGDTILDKSKEFIAKKFNFRDKSSVSTGLAIYVEIVGGIQMVLLWPACVVYVVMAIYNHKKKEL